MDIVQKIENGEVDPKALLIDGMNNAVIGIEENSGRICYSKTKIIEILTEDMTEEDALEHYSYNIQGAYVGEFTPILVDDSE